MSDAARDNARTQRAHWDRVLSADNIGDDAGGRETLERELQFTDTPETHLLIEALHRHSGKAVLDLGGGLGVMAVVMAREAPGPVIVADVSGERLRALTQTLAEIGLSDRIHPVQTTAEQLALRSEALGVVWTKSVLIHTVLEESAGEIARVLAPGGEAVLCEPTTANPLVNLYRRLFAPKEWESITRYFTPEREETVRAALGEGPTHRLHVLSFLAFIWQFTFRSPALFGASLAVLHSLDRLLGAMPWYRRRAWFAVMTARRPSP